MMGRHTFVFNNVLPVDKVDDFYERLKDFKSLDMLVNGRCRDVVLYMDCRVEGLDTSVRLQEMTDRNYPKLRNVVGRIQFASKQKLADVKRFLLSGFGKTLCSHLFVVPAPNVEKCHGGFVQEPGLGWHRRSEWGKFKKRKEQK